MYSGKLNISIESLEKATPPPWRLSRAPPAPRARGTRNSCRTAARLPLYVLLTHLRAEPAPAPALPHSTVRSMHAIVWQLAGSLQIMVTSQVFQLQTGLQSCLSWCRRVINPSTYASTTEARAHRSASHSRGGVRRWGRRCCMGRASSRTYPRLSNGCTLRPTGSAPHRRVDHLCACACVRACVRTSGRPGRIPCTRCISSGNIREWHRPTRR